MTDNTITLPSKPRIVKEEEFTGIYEIDGLYPGYGHTLGNSLRRIILSSIPGAAITAVKIDGVPHEFSTIRGVKEDVVTILLNLKKVRLKLLTDEAQTITLNIKGQKRVTAEDMKVPGQIELLNPEQYLMELTEKSATVDIEIRVERGLGYVPKEVHQKEKVEIGAIALDAIFTPIRRASYEVENMRVGDRTDFNRLRLFIETDGTLSAKEALEKSIEIMVMQLKAIVGFKEEVFEMPLLSEEAVPVHKPKVTEPDADFLKTRIESLDLSSRTINALTSANIRTVGGLVRKKESDVLEIEGMGQKGLQEIKEMLAAQSITLKA
jgi:DNA-directed RNA polymerase subunit alpha